VNGRSSERTEQQPSQAAEKLSRTAVLKRHDFSRADTAPKLTPASAAEGMVSFLCDSMDEFFRNLFRLLNSKL
jgi:hypothetical protein